MELNLQGGAGVVNVADAVFGVDFKEALIHQVVTAYMNAGRAGTKAQKTRSQVQGGGIKPWRQKGTGRARSGTIRSPIWRSGGNAFAASPRNYDQKVNKKMYRGALRSIVSELLRQERLVVVEQFAVEAPKTKQLLTQLQAMDLNDVLIVVDTLEENLYLAARNVYKIGVCEVAAIDPLSLLGYEKVLMTVGALKALEERLA